VGVVVGFGLRASLSSAFILVLKGERSARWRVAVGDVSVCGAVASVAVVRARAAFASARRPSNSFRDLIRAEDSARWGV
jgi:hypothetical protein